MSLCDLCGVSAAHRVLTQAERFSHSPFNYHILIDSAMIILVIS